MSLDALPWVLFLLFVAGMLALDLGVFHRKAHEVRRKEALLWSVFWIGLSLIFNAGIYLFEGVETGVEWTTGYLIEKSLSVDNVFLFLLIFSTFAVPAKYQHRVLFWGILGAIVMRAVLIVTGSWLLDTFHFMIFIFGGFLIVTGVRFLLEKEKVPSLETNKVVKLARRIFPITQEYEGQKFFLRRAGVLFATPLFLVLLLIETTDLIFALDSIPAIFAVTDDTFVVFTSNIFAILGLRALYFVLAGYLAGLRFLKPALAAILVFVGSKMVVAEWYKIDPLISLGVIVVVLSIAVWASMRFRKHEVEAAEALGPESMRARVQRQAEAIHEEGA